MSLFLEAANLPRPGLLCRTPSNKQPKLAAKTRTTGTLSPRVYFISWAPMRPAMPTGTKKFPCFINMLFLLLKKGWIPGKKFGSVMGADTIKYCQN
jgi:hypothetical protein